MKVIAVIGGRGSKYLCEIDHTEIEKYMGQYYGNMEKLKEGGELDLSKGFDFYSATKEAMQKTESFITAHKRTIDTIFNGIKLFNK